MGNVVGEIFDTVGVVAGAVKYVVVAVGHAVTLGRWHFSLPLIIGLKCKQTNAVIFV